MERSCNGVFLAAYIISFLGKEQTSFGENKLLYTSELDEANPKSNAVSEFSFTSNSVE